ncbi:MAG: hypothetical protein PHV61_00815 [Limnochordia bacterium]|jgi:polyhydroxyalkanoate synthesis regulator phasin|nr:hypothetical protein [Limnochordia bacterium]MDD2628703.1 hypothetical protein [Limnochordia bacterium]MDD4517066.1 hypothetical protein [Limnochordia bacterium]
MASLFDRFLLTSLGLAALSMEKLEEVVNDFVKQGRMSVDEGQKLVEAAQARFTQEGQELSAKAWEKLGGIMSELGFVRKDELKELELELAQLKERVLALEKENPS